jgi:hypothetical protein
MSACSSSTPSVLALLAPLHDSCIKSAEGVGRIEGLLPQLHSMIVKIALNMIRVVNIFHHVSVNGTVNYLSLCAGRCRFLLTSGDGFLRLFILCCMLAVYLVAVRIPAYQVTGQQRAPAGRPAITASL